MQAASSRMLFVMAFLIVILASGNADNWFTRRRNQQSFQRPLSSHFRQRIGVQGRNPSGSRDYQQRELPPNAAAVTSDRESSSYAASSYDSYDNYGSYGSGGSGGSVNPLSALVAPLAALALLGAAAAVSTNPVLLSVAVLSSGRKRRALDDDNSLTPELETQLHEMEVLEQYIAKVPGQEEEQEKLMATYISCSGFTEPSNHCLDRVVCEYSVQPGGMADLEKDVISIVLLNIMSNNYVTKEYKERLRTAAQYGRNGGHCSVFTCNQLTQKF